MNTQLYGIMQRRLDAIIEDSRILAGDIVGPSSMDWHDIADRLTCNLRAYASDVALLRSGTVPFPTFPEVRIDDE